MVVCEREGNRHGIIWGTFDKHRIWALVLPNIVGKITAMRAVRAFIARIARTILHRSVEVVRSKTIKSILDCKIIVCFRFIGTTLITGVRIYIFQMRRHGSVRPNRRYIFLITANRRRLAKVINAIHPEAKQIVVDADVAFRRADDRR